MKKISKTFGSLFIVHCSLFIALLAPQAVYSAAPAAGAGAGKTSVLSNGTKVRAKVDAKGLYSEDCWQTYFGCMDQFCITENVDGGTCSCSDENAAFADKMAKIQKQLDDAHNLETIEVEKVQAGAKADIIFNGARQYDKAGNVITVDAAKKAAAKKKDLFSAWDDAEDFDPFAVEDFSSQTGAALYNSARELCVRQIPESCNKDMTILTQLYSAQIKSDCKAFDNLISKAQKEADQKTLDAQAAVRTAVRENFDKQNEYDRGTCMVNFRGCMQGKDACGSDWMNCVSTIASENMQNNKRTKDVSKEKVAHAKIGNMNDQFGLTDTTFEMLDAKRNICENVLDKCVAVRDFVWGDFLREASPTIKLAELNIESKFRQSCLKDISDCVLKNTDNIEAFLAYPDIARSTCKLVVEPCERMEPLIWSYAKDKLASMRVDACTEEVKQCFTAAPPVGCGEDFSSCIGMDFKYMHQMCPVDKLVVCKQGNPKFSLSDIDAMLFGFFLNVDNSALDNCQNQVEAKMQEICGSTTDCDKFAADDIIGTGSLQSQKDGNIYRVTGMISFGSIKMGDASGTTRDHGEDKTVRLGPGEIGVEEYIKKLKEKNTYPEDAGIISNIESEFRNIAGNIKRVITMIEQAPKIQYCINGRDMSQVTGKAGSTVARFPNLLNQVKMQIAV
ncbi:MAG: hypothetical protein LBJ18_02250, partial [Rickettsiales bacterium]|nr:hypothetical protein [Rickettsiales bacterium]